MNEFTNRFGWLACTVAAVSLCAMPAYSQAGAPADTPLQAGIPEDASADSPLQADGPADAPVQAETSSAESLDIPDDIVILSSQDTGKRQATAIVNGNIITGTDVDQRVALIINANEATPSAEELKRLRVQVLRNLIDETLQIQEAQAQDIAVSDDEVDSTYNRLATERFRRSLPEMEQYLTSFGSSPNSLKRQIKGELAWDRLLRRNVAPYVNVAEGEVNELYERLQASRGTDEYRIGEIYLSANSANRDAVQENARRIVEQLRQGGSFVGYARQFSEASTAAVGGDLGWIRLEQLQNPQLEAAARNLQPGQLVGPVEIPGGYSILYLIDKRQVGMADPRDAVLSLKQISLDFKPGTSQDQARQLAATFAESVSNIRGCGEAESVAASIGAQVVANDGIAIRSLPDALQTILLDLNVGQATPPFGSLEDGVRVLLLCGRDDPAATSGPDVETLMAQIEDDRINKRAQRYLRDLRRDAVIEYN